VKRLSRNFDLLLIALIVGGFVTVAAQKLATVPVPETDEAYILQVAYELVYRGQLSWPMYRYLGGNIENVWHTFMPVYFLIVAGFFKVFGWGIAQGRALHLLFSGLTLFMVHLMGRRLFSWRVGLVAVSMLAADQAFFERARLIRYEPIAGFFALLAFYLYELAEEKKRGRLYVAAGVAAGIGIMCHTNILYMFGGILLLMLLRHGVAVLKRSCFYQYTIPAVAISSYVIIYDLIDYQNVVLQNREDKLHFRVLEGWGFLQNLAEEQRRYLIWFNRGEMSLSVAATASRIFQSLAVLALLYLIVRAFVRLRRKERAFEDSSTHLMVITLASILFHALITSHKQIYYIANITPLLALCVGVMLDDAFHALMKTRAGLRPALKWAPSLLIVPILVFGAILVRQYRDYARQLRNPDAPNFEEIKTALRSIVPSDVCPVAIKAPAMWLAFPESDRCFASIENRMREAIDLEGNEYAILVPSPYGGSRIAWTREFDARYPLIGELRDTAYRTIRIYYTGSRGEYRSTPTRTYHFFENRRGYVGPEQLSRAREVWSSVAEGSPNGGSIDQDPLSSAHEGRATTFDVLPVQLMPNKAYELKAAVVESKSGSSMLVIDDATGATLAEAQLASSELQEVALVFKSRGSRIRIATRQRTADQDLGLRAQRVSVREIPGE